MSKVENKESIYKSLNEALLGGTSGDIRKIVRSRKDVYRIDKELRNFTKQRKEIANSIDIYLNSTFAKSFNSTFSAIFFAFIASPINNLIKSIAKAVLTLSLENELPVGIEMYANLFTLIAMGGFIFYFLRDVRKIWFSHLDLKNDLLLLKSQLEEE